MPYCVKCGVKLDLKEDICPLCNTPVYNPDNKHKPKTDEVLYRERATVRYIKNRYINISGFCIFAVMLILTIINISINGKISWSALPLLSLALLWFLMVFPVKYNRLNPAVISLICVMTTCLYLLLVDIITGFNGWSVIVLLSCALAAFSPVFVLTNKRFKNVSVISFISLFSAAYILLLDLILGFTGWSVYGAGGMALAWSFTLLPFYIKKYRLLLAMFFNSMLILAYLFFILSVNGHSSYFLTFAVPIVFTATLPVMLTYLFYKLFNLSIYGILALCFFFASLCSLSVDLILNLNIFNNSIMFNKWAIITSVCCMVFALLLFVIERSYKLKEILNKKLNL